MFTLYTGKDYLLCMSMMTIILLMFQLKGRVLNEFSHPGDFIVKTAEKEKAVCIVIGNT